MTATCHACGQTWPRDPRLEVACPTCLSEVGVNCRRPSGHDCGVHIPREQLAVDLGFLAKECPASPEAATRNAPRQLALI